MTGSEHSERTLDGLAAQPLDDADGWTMAAVRAAYDARDPVPSNLVERVHFAVALEAMFEEVAAISRVPHDELATRSEQAATRTETLTFSAERLTAMVTVTRLAEGRLRLDGWLAPPEPLGVGLRMAEGPTRETTADDHGRFSFADLDQGLAQLRFAPTDPEGPAGPRQGDSNGTVVTPVFEL